MKQNGKKNAGRSLARHSRRSDFSSHLLELSGNIKISKWKSILYVPAFTTKNKYLEALANQAFRLVLQPLSEPPGCPNWSRLIIEELNL